MATWREPTYSFQIVKTSAGWRFEVRHGGLFVQSFDLPVERKRVSAKYLVGLLAQRLKEAKPTLQWLDDHPHLTDSSRWTRTIPSSREELDLYIYYSGGRG